MTRDQLDEIRRSGEERALIEALAGKLNHLKNAIFSAGQLDGGKFNNFEVNLKKADELNLEVRELFTELRKVNPAHE